VCEVLVALELGLHVRHVCEDMASVRVNMPDVFFLLSLLYIQSLAVLSLKPGFFNIPKLYVVHKLVLDAL